MKLFDLLFRRKKKDMKQKADIYYMENRNSIHYEGCGYTLFCDISLGVEVIRYRTTIKDNGYSYNIPISNAENEIPEEVYACLKILHIKRFGI